MNLISINNYFFISRENERYFINKLNFLDIKIYSNLDGKCIFFNFVLDRKHL